MATCTDDELEDNISFTEVTATLTFTEVTTTIGAIYDAGDVIQDEDTNPVLDEDGCAINNE